MTEAEFKQRTKLAASAVVQLVEALPRSKASEHFGKQLLRSASSVACNYRAASRARSDAEMAAKLGIVEEEADESIFWMEMVVDNGIVDQALVADLQREFGEILAMIIASRKTIRKHIQSSGSMIREVQKEYLPQAVIEIGNRQSEIGN